MTYPQPRPQDMRQSLFQLETDGFVVIPGPIPPSKLGRLSEAYDLAFCQSATELKHGSSNTNTRLGDFVNRDAMFDAIYVHEPMLIAAAHIIGARFKLSAFHARTVHPHAVEQRLHQDIEPFSDGFPLLGFIFMVDDFTADNGATRFVRGSCRTQMLMPGTFEDRLASACGPAGAMILFNGSVWHGFGANTTGAARRSLQGAFIRRDLPSATDHAGQTRPDVAARLSNTARDLLCLGEPG